MTSLTDTLAHAELLEVLAPAMREAGALIEDIKARGIVHHDKADSSPVTEADEAAEALLEAAIRRIEPGAVIVGEEAVAAGTIPDVADRFWLILITSISSVVTKPAASVPAFPVRKAAWAVFRPTP